MVQKVPDAMLSNDPSATYVALTGNQSVAGVKTFGSAPVIGSAPMATPGGAAPLYSCRAFCTFDGTLTGTNAPTNGGNVTSVTRNSAGSYTINFTTALPTAAYAVCINSARFTVVVSRAVGSLQIETDSLAGAAADASIISVALFC